MYVSFPNSKLCAEIYGEGPDAEEYEEMKVKAVIRRRRHNGTGDGSGKQVHLMVKSELCTISIR